MKYFLFLFLLLPFRAQAQQKLGESIGAIGGLGLLAVSSMHDMTGERRRAQIAGGLWQTEVPLNNLTESFSASGANLAFAIKKEFSPQFGVGLIGSMVISSNDNPITSVSQLAPDTAAAALPGSGASGGTFSDIYGNAVGVMFTYDPYPNPEGFRLPISLGPMFFWKGFRFEHTFNNPSNGNAAQTESAEVANTNIGIFANVSFDFLAFGTLRIMPGILYAKGFTSDSELDYQYEIDQGGTVSKFDAQLIQGDDFSEFYTALLYVPWNISFTLNFLNKAKTSYSFSYNFNF